MSQPSSTGAVCELNTKCDPSQFSALHSLIPLNHASLKKEWGMLTTVTLRDDKSQQADNPRPILPASISTDLTASIRRFAEPDKHLPSAHPDRHLHGPPGFAAQSVAEAERRMEEILGPIDALLQSR